ncbi:hypothetical protein [Hymenobacter koreensis]|uniref:hypothetical protein n=1 Tax=Hymenobacter koreensis TaxID=1084523 RepID=UPI0031EAAF6B
MLLLGFVVPFVSRLGLLLLLPLSAVGLFLTWRGFQLARRSGDTEKKDVGYANLILGVILLGLGLVGLGLAYMMVS